MSGNNPVSQKRDEIRTELFGRLYACLSDVSSIVNRLRDAGDMSQDGADGLTAIIDAGLSYGEELESSGPPISP